MILLVILSSILALVTPTTVTTMNHLMNRFSTTDNHFFTASMVKTNGLIPVNILLLLPTNDTYKFSMAKVIASLDLAINDIKKTDYGRKFELNIISDVCDCGGIRAPVNAMENIYRMRNHSMVFQAVFGPMCD